MYGQLTKYQARSRGIEYSIAHGKTHKETACQHGMHGVEQEKTLKESARRELAGNVGWKPLQYYRRNHWVAHSRM